jgi:hypothetical protein
MTTAAEVESLLRARGGKDPKGFLSLENERLLREEFGKRTWDMESSHSVIHDGTVFNHRDCHGALLSDVRILPFLVKYRWWRNQSGAQRRRHPALTVARR